MALFWFSSRKIAKMAFGDAHAVPWLTKLATAVLRGRLEQEQDGLAREAVRNLERLGPTFLKLGQVLSIRYVVPLHAAVKTISAA